MARFPVLTALILSALAAPAPAQEAPPHLSIELNAAEAMEGACKLSFLVENSHASDVAGAVYEAVLFDTDGGVERLTLFDFGTLPAGRPRVRQFAVPGLSCDKLGRVLINGTQSCDAPGLGEDACSKGLELKSRIAVEMIG